MGLLTVTAGSGAVAFSRFHDEQAQAEAAELKRLLSLLASTHTETLRQLDLAERKLDDTLAYLASAPE